MKLNLGCGNNFHKEWINIDFNSNSPEVFSHNLHTGIPYDNESIEYIYTSHVLEHFTFGDAKKFLNEIFRVLKKKGILRVVVPDLEQIILEYTKNLTLCIQNPTLENKEKYYWILLELFDQISRNKPGGEMSEFWNREDKLVNDYLISRMGLEYKNFLNSKSKAPLNSYTKPKKLNYIEKLKSFFKFKANKFENSEEYKIGTFRKSGEIHYWMYDRFSLVELLKEVGFKNANQVTAIDSSIPEFNKYLLDITELGETRKPDSLFVEAIKII